MSCVTPESAELVQLFIRSKVIGRDVPSKTLARMADAFVILTGEENKLDNARHEAEIRETKNK